MSNWRFFRVNRWISNHSTLFIFLWSLLILGAIYRG